VLRVYFHFHIKETATTLLVRTKKFRKSCLLHYCLLLHRQFCPWRSTLHKLYNTKM